MFTGIITHKGIIADASRSKFVVRAPRALAKKLARGSSVAVDGVCLTVVAKTADSFSADLMPETLEKTTLGGVAKGAQVNLELPATQKTFLSGHIVQGHVEGVGKVKSIQLRSTSRIVSVGAPRALLRHMLPKGSVAVNGVSLTVIGVTASGFTVGIIPHTWRATTFHYLTEGGAVNIETDILAKYSEKRINHKKKT